MSRNNGKSPKVDMKLELSLPPRIGGPSRRNPDEESPRRRSSSSSSSSPSSCVSSEAEQRRSPEATSMVLTACPGCHMYMMLPEDDPKCPKCHSVAVLLDFLDDNKTRK